MEATRGFIDVYFDNVGGRILDMCLGQAKQGARFVQCGMITQYSRGDKQLNLTNYFKVISMRIKIQGFVVADHTDLWPRAREEMARWAEQGRLKADVTIVDGGLDVVDQFV
ncbi:hypothetical protein J3459_006767 [Metarhizium acridum]|nr:hypothetical protein J3459_006767 [Metarhizium acridum]